MKNKLQNAPEKSEVFCVVGNLKKERFVLRGGTLRFIFSERFVLRIIYVLRIEYGSENVCSVKLRYTLKGYYSLEIVEIRLP